MLSGENAGIRQPGIPKYLKQVLVPIVIAPIQQMRYRLLYPWRKASE